MTPEGGNLGGNAAEQNSAVLVSGYSDDEANLGEELEEDVEDLDEDDDLQEPVVEMEAEPEKKPRQSDEAIFAAILANQIVEEEPEEVAAVPAPLPDLPCRARKKAKTE